MDYTTIADADPGGDLDSAYAAMIAQTVASSNIVMVTDKTMDRALGLSSAERIGLASKTISYLTDNDCRRSRLTNKMGHQ